MESGSLINALCRLAFWAVMIFALAALSGTAMSYSENVKPGDPLPSLILYHRRSIQKAFRIRFRLSKIP